MSQSSYLVIDGMCNATACIQNDGQQCLIHLSFYSTYSEPCDIWLVDGISASRAISIAQGISMTQHLDFSLSPQQLISQAIQPMRAGICISSGGKIIAQGFPGGTHFPQMPFWKEQSSTSLPPFAQHFGHPYGLCFSATTLQQLPLHKRCKHVLEQDPGIQHSCRIYQGCYGQRMGQTILMGLPWTPCKDPLPLLPLLPIQCYLPPLHHTEFGCLLWGIHLEKKQFFPVILRSD